MILFAAALTAIVTAPGQNSKPNYAEHIAPILNKHCVSCHRPGETAPFSLIGYMNAKKWSKMAAVVTESKSMPPWKAEAGFGEFHDENRLSEIQISMLRKWVDTGTPRGDIKLEPKTPTFPVGWSLGKPDYILKASKPFELAAEGPDQYRHFVFPNPTDKDLWVKAMDVKPSNRTIVHHVIAYVDTSGTAKKLLAQTTDGQEGYDAFGSPGFIPYSALGGWAPGMNARKTSPGLAYRVPAKSSIVLQVHYHRTGKIEKDQTEIGLYTANAEKIDKEINLWWLANPFFNIPAGAKNHEVKLNQKISRDSVIHAVQPHMHWLGKSMEAELVLPDGTVTPLIRINDWDFNWQMQYSLKTPIQVPAGSSIKVRATFDNSSDNPRNPNNPPKATRWGEATTDEMMLFVIAATRK